MSQPTAAEVAAGIRATIGAHTQAQDAGRVDDVVAQYTPDGVLEVPGQEPLRGHEAIRAAFEGWASQMTGPSRHFIANTVVTSWSEEEATAESDAALFARGESGWGVQLVGHYEDTLRLRDGVWQFQHRKTTYLT
ncbi:nuclear transport factor 2 family protein [Nocardia sp. CA2R105]|uniref:nuclear transport factor 2 family protein n=1 Tax=Nocardia coffeae TaxID=2873381 RepID=UPI001CA709EC|nr:nuclear transport factor 2 family protein [Nocardia coffeae]MBY8860949.1 nuclear transport factor 2 family protein [Nocardia coffeae]